MRMACDWSCSDGPQLDATGARRRVAIDRRSKLIAARYEQGPVLRLDAGGMRLASL